MNGIDSVSILLVWYRKVEKMELVSDYNSYILVFLGNIIDYLTDHPFCDAVDFLNEALWYSKFYIDRSKTKSQKRLFYAMKHTVKQSLKLIKGVKHEI